LARVKTNAAKQRHAKDTGEHVHLKRQPAQPREARTISAKDNKPENVTPIAYETTI
jgi:large subunit ribosomal protein L21e